MGQCEDDTKIPFPVVHSILIRRECISCIFLLVERQIRDKKLQLKCGWSVKTTSGITPYNLYSRGPIHYFFHLCIFLLTHLQFSLTMREVPQSFLQGPLGSASHVCLAKSSPFCNVAFVRIEPVQRFDLKLKLCVFCIFYFIWAYCSNSDCPSSTVSGFIPSKSYPETGICQCLSSRLVDVSTKIKNPKSKSRG